MADQECVHNWRWDTIYLSEPPTQLMICRNCSTKKYHPICSRNHPCADCKEEGCKCVCHSKKK